MSKRPPKLGTTEHDELRFRLMNDVGDSRLPEKPEFYEVWELYAREALLSKDSVVRAHMQKCMTKGKYKGWDPASMGSWMPDHTIRAQSVIPLLPGEAVPPEKRGFALFIRPVRPRHQILDELKKVAIFQLQRLMDKRLYSEGKLKDSPYRSTTTKNQLEAWVDWFVVYKAVEDAKQKGIDPEKYYEHVLKFYEVEREPAASGDRRKRVLPEFIRAFFYEDEKGRPIPIPKADTKNRTKRPHPLVPRAGHNSRAINHYIEDRIAEVDTIIANVARGLFPGEH